MTQRQRPNRQQRRRDQSWQGHRAPQESTAAGGWRSQLSLGRLGIAVTGLAVVAVLAWVVYDATSNGSSDPAEDTSASLPGVFFEDQGRGHLQAGAQNDQYNSNPPTSGAHDPAPAPWGVNPNPVTKEKIVHNLEHGGVAILYNCPTGCDDVTKALGDYTKKRTGEGHYVLMAPFPNMKQKIALVAWTRLDEFDELDMGRVERFVDAHLCRFDPESICR